MSFLTALSAEALACRLASPRRRHDVAGLSGHGSRAIPRDSRLDPPNMSPHDLSQNGYGMMLMIMMVMFARLIR